MNVLQVKLAIAKWGQINNTALGLDYLTSGTGFEISREEYNKWLQVQKYNQKPIDSIHVYLGIWGMQFVFILVDSISDENENYKIDENLFIKSFVPNLDISSPVNDIVAIPSIELPEDEAMKRSLRWQLYSKYWFKNNQTEFVVTDTPVPHGILRAMTVPFIDLSHIFDNTKAEHLYSFFGIQEDQEYGNIIELILCDNPTPVDGKLVTPKFFMDVTKPVPPFSPSGYNLL
ncbi:hypothetical protein ACE193_24835 [Bernardetia sp. OM2101]|uniref:hypothetical protein n=1 Tax=Bernardetia sp. OM2101 TaxID=3344876 RepID=UPI0035CEBDF1